MEYVIREERVPAAEYIEFLKHTGLGSQYPRERFAERIPVLLERAAISLTARDPDNRLIGVCLAITDFAYWLFLTDLGVVRDWVHRGVGTALVRKALEIAGGEKNIIMYTCANEDAVPFYKKLGMTRPNDMFVYDHMDWTPFTVE